MSREPIRIWRVFQTVSMRNLLLWDIRHRFQWLSPGYGQVAHALRTLPPVAARVLLPRAAPRLACVKPAASVHPEPGSNSSLYIFYSSSLLLTLLISKEINALDSYLFSRYLLVLPSVFSMNFLVPITPEILALNKTPPFWDCKGKNLFCSYKLFLKNF